MQIHYNYIILIYLKQEYIEKIKWFSSSEIIVKAEIEGYVMK